MELLVPLQPTVQTPLTAVLNVGRIQTVRGQAVKNHLPLLVTQHVSEPKIVLEEQQEPDVLLV